jgi:Skp family chaperone for outer membrane proteins
MNRTGNAAAWSLCAWLAGMTLATGADVKIGVVDMNRLIKAHPDTAAAQAAVRKMGTGFEAEQVAIVAPVNKLRDEFEAARTAAQNRALSEAARQREQTVAEEKLGALREAEQKARETLLRRQRELQEQTRDMENAIADKILVVVEAVAKERELTLVVDRSAQDARGRPIVLFQAESADMTDEVVKKMAAK